MLVNDEPIESARQVQEQVQQAYGFDASEKLIRKTMKQDLKMSFRLAKRVPKQGNTERCLVLRQQYAIKMMELLEEGRRIINVDESWLNETSFYRKLWHPKDQVCSVPMQTVSPRLSLIAAIDTDGRTWYTLTQANTYSDVMLLFFKHLIEWLDQETPMWREDAVFLLDGARYHTSPETKEHLRRLGL